MQKSCIKIWIYRKTENKKIKMWCWHVHITVWERTNFYYYFNFFFMFSFFVLLSQCVSISVSSLFLSLAYNFQFHCVSAYFAAITHDLQLVYHFNKYYTCYLVDWILKWIETNWEKILQQNIRLCLLFDFGQFIQWICI